MAARKKLVPVIALSSSLFLCSLILQTEHRTGILNQRATYINQVFYLRLHSWQWLEEITQPSAWCLCKASWVEGKKVVRTKWVMCPYLCVGLCWTLTWSSCDSTELLLLSQTGTGRPRRCSLRVRGLQHRNLALNLILRLGLQGQLAWVLVVQLGSSSSCALVWPILQSWGEDFKLRTADLGLLGNLLWKKNNIKHYYNLVYLCFCACIN